MTEMEGEHMTDATTQFFEELGRRDHDPLLEHASGTVRVDIANGKKLDHWFVTIDKGDVTVSRRSGKADASLAASSAVFEAIATGVASPFAAALRGTLQLDGDWRLLNLFRRLLPGPPTSKRISAADSERSRR